MREMLGKVVPRFHYPFLGGLIRAGTGSDLPSSVFFDFYNPIKTFPGL
jgi:hypothetical protein